MNRTLLVIGALFAAAVVFVAVNILSTAALPGARLDLTEGRLYTLSQGSRNIAAKVDEPITLTLYYSEKASADFPGYKSYATRVREVLRELARASGGKIVVKPVDPEPFSDSEQEAAGAGLAGMPSGRNTERFYFGLVGENSTDRKEVIPLFDPSKEEFLEYELTRMVYLLSNPQKKSIGVMAQLPVEGMKDYPLMRGQNVPAWKFMDALKDYFDVKSIPADKPEIPADLKVLVLIHPKSLSDAAQYSIDQFVLRGGRLLVFVDPYCQADLPPGIDEMKAMQLPRNSHLEKLFDAWGIEMVPEKFAADVKKGLEINVGSQQAPEIIRFVAFLGLDKENFSASDAVTSELEHLNFAMPGVLQKKAGSSIAFTPLIETTTDSGLMNVSDVKWPGDPKKLLTQFVSGNQKLTIAARLAGKVNTAFPGGDPAKPEAPKDGSAPPPAKEHLAQSKDDINVIVVADCDMLADRLWVQEQRLGQISLGFAKFADNGDFVVSAVDNLCGSKDLIGLRARGKAARPFDRIQEIQTEADKRTLTKVQEIQAKQQQAEQRITDLARKAPPGATKIILPPEDQAEMNRLKKERLALGGELRKIQLERNRNVEKIGRTVKYVNIALMPILVGVAAVGLGAYRANRRRAWSRSLGARS